MPTPYQSAMCDLHYLYPATVFVWFAVSSLFSVFTLQNKHSSKTAQSRQPNRNVTAGLQAAILLTFILQLVISAIFSSRHQQLWRIPEDVLVGDLGMTLVFGLLFCQIYNDPCPAWYIFGCCALIAVPFETAINILQWTSGSQTIPRIIYVSDAIIGALRFTFLLLLGGLFCYPGICKRAPISDEETQSLLNKNNLAQNGDASYGTANSGNDRESRWERRLREAREGQEKELEAQGNWITYAKRFAIFFPIMWPVGLVRLQIRALAVIMCLFASNAVNLLIPRQTGIVMDSLSGANATNPWLAVMVYIILKFVASESGIELLRQWLWVPVKYYAYESITRAAYSHIMYLSADFHDSKNTSDLIMAINGGVSVSSIVESLLLKAAPMLVDLCVAVVYLSVTFGSFEGLLTIATGTIFLILASTLIARSRQASRGRVHSRFREYSTRTRGFQGWSTASSFNQIGYEDNRHADIVSLRWEQERSYIMNWIAATALQSAVLTFGLAASALYAVLRIRNGQATSGQFAMLIMYWSQLCGPLNFFSSLGKNISDDFVEAEQLLNIMLMNPSVKNRRGARPLKFIAGEIEFDDICFSYDKKKDVINHVSLRIPSGTTVAFVGSTGAGKSTLLKLLDRFYDVTEGSIRFDGQDIKEVDLYSLRERIGVVPQNPVLFGDTVMNNVRYGKITATDEEVHDACRAACIHDKIMDFAEGYDAQVGENGVKLSGGELQRLAIARAILKQPDLVLLDEATSAVDTDTEQKIQMSFQKLCEGRTAFIVAHRLSTIMSADLIVVVEKGRIIEKGNHETLIAEDGRYADLWKKQAFLKPHKYQDVEDQKAGSSGVVNGVSEEKTKEEASKTSSTKKDAKQLEN